MSRTFDDIAGRRRRVRGCPRCGAPSPNAGSVSVYAQRFGPHGSMVGGARVASRSISLCEPCAVEVYEAMHEALLEDCKVAE